MKINRLALLTFAAAASLSAAGLSIAALADGGPMGGHAGGFLKAADTNKDGVIDQTEFAAGRDKWFADLDANKDGFVSTDELKAFGDKMHAEWAKKHADANAPAGAPDQKADRQARFIEHVLTRVDADKDGKISKAEFDAEGSTMFKRMDKNSDGKIASDEMPQRHGGRFAGHMFDRADADHDGKVTKAEFTAAGDQMFQKMDKNGDGAIEKDEVRMGHGHGETPDGDVPPAPDQAPTP
jgi:hypothetical protein